MCFISPVLAFIIQVTIQDSKGLVVRVLRSSVCISADCCSRQLVIMSNGQRAAVELRMGRFIP